MISGAMKMDRNSVFARIGLIAVLALWATSAVAWEQPKEWPELGMVSKWEYNDSRFYRIREDAPYMDKSQLKMDQIKHYAKTLEYNGTKDGIGLQTFLAKDAGEQAERRKLAARELKFVADFRMRVETLVQRTRQDGEIGWGDQVNDMTVIGDCLGKLKTATGLDPSNPYAWHVLAYFANTVGDRSRSAAALNGAQAALDQIPEDQLTELRGEVALDRAWMQRDLGEFEAAGISLKKAVEYGVTGTEPRLLQGLIAAQTGNTQAAIEVASALREAEVRAFPANLTSVNSSPELNNVDAWRARTSNYLQSWILALTWLHEGNVDMAAAAFGTFKVNDQYPYAQRFWNDAGWIYEVTGRRSLAETAWSMARMNTPYIVYFVYKPYAVDLGNITGRPGAVPFFLGFDQFYTTGSRLAFGSALVEMVAAAEDEQQKQVQASRALDELEIYQKTGIYPAQAQVLRGQIYYLVGDLASALMEVEAALEVMDEQGDKAGFSAVLQGLAKSDNDLGASDIANFYSQSGSSGGRWMNPDDIAGQLAGLRQAYGIDPSDENRQALARFLIRRDDPVEGRELAMGPLKGQELSSANITKLSGDDLALLLEADRTEGDDELALALVKALEGGAADPWNHSGLWILAGFICLDSGDLADGKVALERASSLDPGNQGLKIQLALMEGQ